MQLEAVINNVTFYNEENSFAILQLNTKNKRVTAKGVCPDLKMLYSVERAKGLSCLLEGNWIKHPKYGEEFEAEKISINTQGMLFFLSNIVSGLGESLAKQLISVYGETLLTDILNNNPDELLIFKGIKEKKLKKIVDSWQKYKSLKDLTEFFANHNVSITSSLLLRIYNFFKENNAINAIKENPYCLTDIRGIGFKTADKLALQLGIEPYSSIRVKALVDYILLSQASDNGHTYLPYGDLLNIAKEEIDQENTDLDTLNEVMQEVLDNENYYIEDSEYIEDSKIALKGYKIQEDWIEKNFQTRLNNANQFIISKEDAEKFIARKEHELHIKLGNKQRQAIFEIATQGYNTFMLCGYAGTGKSTISKIILDFYKENFFQYNEIITCAFTGMASKRIREVTGYKASTIHSLLGFKGDGFEFNKDNPLPYKVILIDESSMINLGLFYSLLKAIPQNTVIIIVGDDAQLPPIGEGNVFADLLSKDWIPKVKLTTIYRQSEDSVLTYFASFIREGKMPGGIYDDYKDFEFLLVDIERYWELKKKLSDKEMKEVRDKFYAELQESFIKYILKSIKNNNLTGTKKIWDIQVITPMRITPLGTKALNDILQRVINDQYKQEIEIRGYLLKQYDKLIHLKNQNMKVVSKDQYDNYKKQGLDLSDMYEKASDKRIYNGNLGMALDIDKENEMFSVLYPEPDGTNTVVLYAFDDYHNIIDLGYALTIHKTQGNQFAYVFIPMINSFYIMLNNKLLYTAITRAKTKVTLMGQFASFKRACENIDDTVRNTWMGGKKE